MMVSHIIIIAHIVVILLDVTVEIRGQPLVLYNEIGTLQS